MTSIFELAESLEDKPNVKELKREEKYEQYYGLTESDWNEAWDEVEQQYYNSMGEDNFYLYM